MSLAPKLVKKINHQQTTNGNENCKNTIGRNEIKYLVLVKSKHFYCKHVLFRTCLQDKRLLSR